MKKIKSGIFGLNPILDGGFNENSTNVIIGSPGTGKTTFATQFIKRGLEMDQSAIFISLDENQDQIIREALERGWPEINDFVKEGLLLFIDASGKEFTINITIPPLDEGSYIIFKTKAIDINAAESDWAVLEITVPRTRVSSYLWFLERFPMLERLLSLLLL